jgi:cytidine deaminase
MIDAVDWALLRAAAVARLAHAYAPYSRFHVAAALLTLDGYTFTGVNVENASYGLTVCAERNALGAAVAAGARHMRALVVVSSGEQPTPPCGACRQVLAEFPPAFEVRCYGAHAGELISTTLALLPHAFGPGHFDPNAS